MNNQPIEKVLEICGEFYSHVLPENEPPSPVIEEFEAFSAAKFFPGRMQCATLSWDEMETFLKSQK
jgi:NifU-like protein involved in Fe-S cluster formation